MTEPLQFAAATPRFALPNLFAAQAQREAFVNEAHARIDMLLHTAVEGVASVPPEAPLEGECWIVGAGASGAWEGNEHAIAGFEAGGWQFAAPASGMHVFDRSNGRFLHFASSWAAPQAPASPVGGIVQDAEMRSAFESLVDALRIAGIFPVME